MHDAENKIKQLFSQLNPKGIVIILFVYEVKNAAYCNRLMHLKEAAIV